MSNWTMYEIGRPKDVAEKIRRKKAKNLLGTMSAEEVRLLNKAKEYAATAVELFKDCPAVSITSHSTQMANGTLSFELKVEPLYHFVG